MGRGFTLLLAAALLGGCTVVDTVRLDAPHAPPILLTTGDPPWRYQSLGLIQATRKGVFFCGAATIPEVSLRAGLLEVLVPEAMARGADGIIRLHFDETLYTPAEKVLIGVAELCVLPYFPAEITVTGEMVRRVR